MKKNLLLIIIFLCFGKGKTQTKRFFYNVTFKIDSINIKKDAVVLEVNKDHNFFFSNEYLLADSLNNRNGVKFEFAYPKFQKIVRWNKDDNSFDMFNNLGGINYYEFKKRKTISWTLCDDTKNIGIYSVQKATASYGGRDWVAWFTNEIPFSYGPYVFYGLPGLILEIYDTKENYHFTFIQNKNLDTENDFSKIIEKRYLGVNKIKIQEKDWKGLQLNYYNNPIPEYKEGLEAVMFKDDGTQYTAKDYRELEKNIQRGIRKYNNPIELDEKLDYK